MGIIEFGNFREMSVKIGKDRKLKKSFGCLPENAGCNSSTDVTMATAYGMHRRFPEGIRNFFLISDETEICEVHVDIARRFSKSIIPLLP